MDNGRYEIDTQGKFMLKPEYRPKPKITGCLINPKFIDKQTLVDNGWWGGLFGKNPYVVSFCDKCQCQRVHYVVDKEWDQDDNEKWRITGFLFFCGVCKERFKNECI